MREVYPGIFMITETESFLSIKTSVNLFVIADDDALIFDAGLGTKSSMRHLASELSEIKAVLASRNKKFNPGRILISHTHPDHFSGLNKIRRMLGVKILLTEKMAKNLTSRESYLKNYFTPKKSSIKILNIYPFSIVRKTMGRVPKLFYKHLYGIEFPDAADEIISDKTKIRITGEEWEIFPSPGHADDHISLYNRKKGILFAGDNVLRTITPWLGPPDSNLKQYIASLKGMLELPKLELILASHGGPISEPKERIKKLIEWRLLRTEQVFNLIEKNSFRGFGVRDILNELYGLRHIGKYYLAEGWVRLTLQYLEEDGRVYSKKTNRGKIFYPAEKN